MGYNLEEKKFKKEKYFMLATNEITHMLIYTLWKYHSKAKTVM